LAAFPYRGGFYPDGPRVNTHTTPLECGNLGIGVSIDIPRLWREEVFISKDTSLLQRSNISIENDASLLSHTSGVLCKQTCPIQKVNALTKTSHP